MKEIESKDLIVGQEYYDSKNVENATLLRFVGFDKEVKSCDFEYVSGSKIYIEIDGVIPFNISEKFYQP